MHKENRGLDMLLFSSASAERKLKIENNRQIVTRIVETIKVIRKRGLNYRGDGCNEAAYSLHSDNIDHGNLLEIVLLVSKFVRLLRTHTENVAKQSQARIKNAKNSRGRGNLVTFLSKISANSITMTISKLIKQKICRRNTCRKNIFYSN
jgi:hypothetical protein